MDFRLWRDDKKQKIKDIKKLWGRHLNVYAKILMLVEQQGDHEGHRTRANGSRKN